METESGHVQENRYDVENLRFELLENGKRTGFVYHDGELLHEEGGNEQQNSYHLGAGIDALQRGQDLSYYHRDEQLSTGLITGRDGEILNGYLYDAFGTELETKEQFPNRIRYTGQQYDEFTEQYYLRARYYNPVLGRFMQEDVYQGDGLNLYAYCANNPVIYYDPSGHIGFCPKGATEPAYDESAEGGTGSQVIPNRYPGEPQEGWEVSYTIENGKIHIDNGLQDVDFIIDMDGNLHIGSGHSHLANGADVQAAGTLKVNSQGYVRSITNASGHYAPTIAQGRSFPNMLNELGVRTQNAWLVLGDYSFTPSGYVDIMHTSTIAEQLR